MRGHRSSFLGKYVGRDQDQTLGRLRCSSEASEGLVPVSGRVVADGVFYFVRFCPAIDDEIRSSGEKKRQEQRIQHLDPTGIHPQQRSPSPIYHLQGETPHPSPTSSSGESRLLTRARPRTPPPKSWSTQPPSWTFLIRCTEEDAARKGGWRGRHSAGAGSRGRCSLLLQAGVGSVPVAWVSVEGARSHGLKGGGG